MALSNTAVPKYYGIFREQVLAGEIPVCKELEMQMQRIDARIENPKYYYDESAVEGWIRFCEEELCLTDGSDWVMLDYFKLWGEDVWGWYFFTTQSVYEADPDHHGGRYVTKEVKHRLTQKQYLIVGRGAAKSVYLTGQQSYVQNVVPKTTKGITTAPTMRQSDEVISLMRTSITRARGPLFKFLTDPTLKTVRGNNTGKPMLAPMKDGIENFATNSVIEIKPMAIDKLQGLRVSCATVDEWLSVDIREDPVGAIEQGASKVKDYLIICASSEGLVRNGPGDSIKMELMSILEGEYINDRVSIFWYKMDSLEELKYPDLYRKANPGIGVTVPYEAYIQDVERAEKVPAARNDILAKRFGIPMEGLTYFFAYQDTLLHNRCDFWGLPCAVGADLSRGDDFCAFAFLFPLKDGTFGWKSLSFITELTLMKLKPAMRIKYDEFLSEGSLIVLGGKPVLDMDEVYDIVEKYMTDNNYDNRCLGYDPYNAKEFVSSYGQFNGEYGIEKVIQGARTETVPLGELKTLAEERAILFDQEIQKFTMGNCITLEDTNGNRKLYKKRNDLKIDCVAALMDAYVAYKINKDMF